MKPIRWLHISDLHIGPNKKDERSQILGAFLKYIVNLKDKNRPFDFVAVTGDIVAGGDYEAKDEAIKFLKELEEKLFPSDGKKSNTAPRSRIFITPGNHDVTRKFGDKIQIESIQKLMGRSMGKTLRNGEFFKAEERSAAEKYLLSRFHAYGELFCEFYGDGDFSDELPLKYLWWTDSFKKDLEDGQKVRVNVSSICSSLLCGIYRELLEVHGVSRVCQEHLKVEPQEYLAFGTENIKRAKTASEDFETINIALAHHRYDSLAIAERGEVKSVIEDNYNLYLCGHIHKEDKWPKPFGSDLYTLQAGSLCEIRDDVTQSFNIGEIDLKANQLKLQTHVYKKGENSWDLSKEIPELTSSDRRAGYRTDEDEGALILPFHVRKRLFRPFEMRDQKICRRFKVASSGERTFHLALLGETKEARLPLKREDWETQVKKMQAFLSELANGNAAQVDNVSIALGIQNVLVVDDRFYFGIRTKAERLKTPTGATIGLGSYNTGYELFQEPKIGDDETPAKFEDRKKKSLNQCANRIKGSDELQNLFITRTDCPDLSDSQSNRFKELYETRLFTLRRGEKEEPCFITINPSRHNPRFEIGVVRFLVLTKEECGQLNDLRYLPNLGRDRYENEENFWVWVSQGEVHYRSYEKANAIPNQKQQAFDSIFTDGKLEGVLIESNKLEEISENHDRYVPYYYEDLLGSDVVLNRNLTVPARNIIELDLP